MDLYYSHPKSSKSDINAKYLTPTISCGCCGNTSFKSLIPLRNKPSINYIKCEHCKAITYDYIYSQQGIDEMYQSSDYYQDYEKHGTSKITFYGAERIAKHILKHIKIEKKNTISVLDFGGGDGAIAYSIAELLLRKFICKDVNIIVVDYNEILYDASNPHIHISRCFPLETIHNDTFEIVIASAVIEHLPVPGSYVKKLFDIAAQNGYIYFRTPYVYPIYKALKKLGINYDTGFPGHIWDLGEEWWCNAASLIGYSESKVKLIHSRPSIVEKSLKAEFIKALAAYIMKSIWYLNHKWKYVGGWETIYQKQ